MTFDEEAVIGIFFATNLNGLFFFFKEGINKRAFVENL